MPERWQCRLRVRTAGCWSSRGGRHPVREGVTAVASAAGSAARRQSRPSAQDARVPQQARGGSADGKTRAADPPVALVPGEGVPAARRSTGSRAKTGDVNGTSADDQDSVGKGRGRSGAAGAKGRQGKKAASELPGRGEHRDNGSMDVTADRKSTRLNSSHLGI